MGTPQTANDDPETLSDEQKLIRICHQLDHLDTVVHEIDRRTRPLEQLTPHLDRALHLLDPMRRVRRGARTAKGAPDGST